MSIILPELPQLSIPADHYQPELHLPIRHWRQNIEQILDNALNQQTPIREIVQTRCQALDKILQILFQFYELDKTNVALFATGGYGRGELHPHSDVDILLLSPNELDERQEHKISLLVASLWDIGIEPAFVVRSVQACDMACQSDITIATTLLETRMLAGNPTLADIPQQLVDKNWTPVDFYHGKMQEAKQRYFKHNATEYNLEPDIKNAPGGLRDIHTVGWVCKRYFRANSLLAVVQQNFITEKEFDDLQIAEDFLWTIRHHLHTLAGRNENRLLFDYQKNIAEKMGYQPKENDHINAQVERFMRDYYRFAMSNSTLSEMLMKHFDEVIIENSLPIAERPQQKILNEHFKQVGEQIAVVHTKVFFQNPTAILEMFLLMGQRNIKYIRTCTLRVLKIASRSIDDEFRQNPINKTLFINNLKEQNLLFWRLRVMNRYGVLGRYLPEFGRIIGLMQYDLYHRYTVDAHILLLVRMFHRFTDKDYDQLYPLASGIYRSIDRKEILVLSAIFHDIAKGRGGDHSELGEIEAIKFCLQHGLNQQDADLVGWLVKQHLLMSITAQKKDTSDPQVIAQFADQVKNVTNLNHLYVLTVADMNATNPQLWNSWRATLMRQLYIQTRRILRADIDAPTNRQDLINNNQQNARELLKNDKDLANIEQLWQEFGDEYFLRETPADIVWHSKAIMHHEQQNSGQPLVILREHRELALDAVQVFIYTQDQSNLFAVTTNVFDQMNLNVLDARIITATRNFAMDSYVLLDRQGTLLTDLDRQAELIERLITAFQSPTTLKFVKKSLPRQLRHFNVPTKVSFERNSETNQHTMLLETLDQPALLARLGQVFLQYQIEVHFARITTLGERAEDMFVITDQAQQTLSEQRLVELKNALIETLKIG